MIYFLLLLLSVDAPLLLHNVVRILSLPRSVAHLLRMRTPPLLLLGEVLLVAVIHILLWEVELVGLVAAHHYRLIRLILLLSLETFKPVHNWRWRGGGFTRPVSGHT